MDLSDEALSVLEELARGDDMYVFRETTLAAPYDLDLIAAARNALLPLIEEVRRLRRELDTRS